MPSQEPNPNPEVPASEGPLPGDAASAVPPETTGVGTSPTRWLWLWTLLAGLVVGLVSGLVGEAVYGTFDAESQIEFPPNFGRMGPLEQEAFMTEQYQILGPPAAAKNTALTYGTLGGLLGLALGVIGGLARRSVRHGLIAGGVGLVAGAAAGAGMSGVMTAYFFRALDPEMGLRPLFLTHGGIWVAVGAASGLALGLGLGGHHAIVKTLLGGLVGGVLGTIVFELIHALAYPLVRIEEPIPTAEAPRILAHLCVAVFVALCAGLSARDRGRRGQPAAPPGETA